MPNLHRLKPRTWRAEDDEVKAAQEHIPDGKNMGAFIRACVRALGQNPAAVLAAIAEHWPEDPKPTGRPRKQPAGESE
ncbi:hypothetical protein ACBJ59_36415 [Nonomuraea sp. MTCD27]|uniref:hypothetical protein n=1 Tax=Nonomuraea sp. MTCD27 TaxID=1676747 RepID=UPI0035BF6770